MESEVFICNQQRECRTDNNCVINGGECAATKHKEFALDPEEALKLSDAMFGAIYYRLPVAYRTQLSQDKRVMVKILNYWEERRHGKKTG